MGEKDLLEYENIGRRIKRSDKYTYVDSTRIEDHGTRLYDVNGARLPSVDYDIRQNQNQQFLKDWKAKVGEQEVRANQNVSSSRGTSMHNSWKNISQEWATMILQRSDRRRKPGPKSY